MAGPMGIRPTQPMQPAPAAPAAMPVVRTQPTALALSEIMVTKPSDAKPTARCKEPQLGESGIDEKMITAVEADWKNAAGSAKVKCNEIINTLYGEYFKHHGYMNISAAGVSSNIKSWPSEPIQMGSDYMGGSFGLDLATSEYPNGARLLFGIDGRLAKDSHSIGVKVNGLVDIGRLSVQGGAYIGYTKIKDVDRYTSVIPFNIREQSADGTYLGKVATPDITVMAPFIGANMALAYSLVEWRLGGGATASILWFGEASAAISVTNFSDDEPLRAVKTADSEIIYTPKTETTETGLKFKGAEEAPLNRNGDSSFGLATTTTTGLKLRYRW